MNTYCVKLGYCGPTDCCLVLSNGKDEFEFGIDTVGWEIIRKYYDHPKSSYIPTSIGDYLLEHANELND